MRAGHLRADFQACFLFLFFPEYFSAPITSSYTPSPCLAYTPVSFSLIHYPSSTYTPVSVSIVPFKISRNDNNL